MRPHAFLPDANRKSSKQGDPNVQDIMFRNVTNDGSIMVVRPANSDFRGFYGAVLMASSLTHRQFFNKTFYVRIQLPKQDPSIGWEAAYPGPYCFCIYDFNIELTWRKLMLFALANGAGIPAGSGGENAREVTVTWTSEVPPARSKGSS